MSAATSPSVSLGGTLVPARFVKRPNRFLVRARPETSEDALGGPERPGVVDCHLPDPGRLRELLVPGARLWLRPAAGAQRRTRWTVVLVESDRGDGLVSLDTTLPNRLVGRALESGDLGEFRGWQLGRAEVTVGRSRFDFLLERESERRLALEVKSVTLVKGWTALFPDAVTVRGRRHVEELADLVRRGRMEAAVLFVVQRPDVRRIRAARSIDPGFAGALEAARDAGVRLLGRRCRVSRAAVTLAGPVPVDVG